MAGDALGRRDVGAAPVLVVVGLFRAALVLVLAVVVVVVGAAAVDDDDAVAGDAVAVGVVGDAGAESLGMR